MRNLECDPATLAGPVDERVVAALQRRHPLPSDFLECMRQCHGGIPGIGMFTIEAGRGRIGRFLTLLDEKSVLVPPFRPHFEQTKSDERVINGIPYLLDYEHPTSRALFADLMPFATLRDGMCLDRASVGLLCLDYRARREAPAVIVWDACRANEAYMDWEDLPEEDQFDEAGNFTSVPWDDFVIPVAASFLEFVEMLQPVAHDDT